jgi:hypothetical protein
MDSPTGFDHDDFFGSYEAEQANAGMSLTPHEFDDAADRPPSREQLAHWGRFRRPVGLIVGAMALLSVVALGKVGSREEASERPLVAHYGSAIAAAPSSTDAIGVDEPRAHDPASGVARDATSDLLPKELSAFVAELWSSFEPPAPSMASATVPLLVTDETDPVETAIENQADSEHAAAFVSQPTPMCLLPRRAGSAPPALDSGGIHGQAPEAWSPPPSMTSSTPSVRP